MLDHLFIATDGALYDTREDGWSTKPPLRRVYSQARQAIMNTADLKATLRAGPYAWPGGYPLYFVTADGAALSFETVAERLNNGDQQGAIVDLNGNTAGSFELGPRQREYTFDVKLWAVSRVKAQSETEARRKLADIADCMDISLETPDGVRFTEASAEGDPNLIEIDGDAV